MWSAKDIYSLQWESRKLRLQPPNKSEVKFNATSIGLFSLLHIGAHTDLRFSARFIPRLCRNTIQNLGNIGYKMKKQEVMEKTSTSTMRTPLAQHPCKLYVSLLVGTGLGLIKHAQSHYNFWMGREKLHEANS